MQQEALHEGWRKVQQVALQYVEDLLQNLRLLDQVLPCSPNAPDLRKDPSPRDANTTVEVVQLREDLAEAQTALQNAHSEVTVRFFVSRFLFTPYSWFLVLFRCQRMPKLLQTMEHHSLHQKYAKMKPGTFMCSGSFPCNFHHIP